MLACQDFNLFDIDDNLLFAPWIILYSFLVMFFLTVHARFVDETIQFVTCKIYILIILKEKCYCGHFLIDHIYMYVCFFSNSIIVICLIWIVGGP